MKAVGYLRVIDKRLVSGIKRQIVAYCKERGYELVDMYVDVGSRSAWDSLVESGAEAEKVVVGGAWAEESANEYFFGKLVLKKRGIEVEHAVREPRGNAMIDGLIEYIVEHDKAECCKRMSIGREEKARAGGYAGGRPPYGYRVEDGALVKDEEEARCVKLVFCMRESGHTLQGIADEVNAAGYRTKGGKAFSRSSIQNILTNERLYRGRLQYNGREYEGNYEKIL